MIEGYTAIRTLGGVSEYRLETNGLTVLMAADFAFPAVTAMVTYRVGSRDEATGCIGATHLLEHMMFKGTKSYRDSYGNSLSQYLERVGARFNATTSIDRTNYYATLSPDHLSGYLAVESDRMRNLLLDEGDFRREVGVVCDEFERTENDPAGKLYRDVYAAAFIAHPYHHPTIGWRSDIERTSLGRLRAFYDTFYWPDNATVSIVGAIDPDAALSLVKQYYGGYSRSPQPIPQVYTREPVQRGPRHVTVKRTGRIAIVQIGHKGVAAVDPDYPALAVLGSILASGKNSRLYRALVDRSLASSVNSGPGFHRDMSLYLTGAMLVPGVAYAEVQRVILEEFAKLQDAGVEAAELERAKSKSRAGLLFQRDGSAGIVSSLNECIAAGDWTLYQTVPAAIQAVTAAEVQRVAQRYLVEDHSTTGWFVPQTGKGP